MLMTRLIPALVIAAAATATPALAAPREFTVTMANMAFSGLPKDAKVGDTIVWTNRDTVPHTATAKDKSFDARVPAGKTQKTVLKAAGTIAIYCIYHPQMRGTLKVGA